MTRSLSSDIKTELGTAEIIPVHLLTIAFGTTVNLTDCSFDLTSSVSGSSITYSASKFILGVSSFTEETDITKTSLTISLSGADTTYIAVVLAENVINDAVTIYRGFLNSSNALIADPFLLYKGTIDTFTITENEKESLLNLGVVSHWADFEKTNGRKTNNISQQRHFSSDVGMDFSSETVKDLKWGRV